MSDDYIWSLTVKELGTKHKKTVKVRAAYLIQAVEKAVNYCSIHLYFKNPLVTKVLLLYPIEIDVP
jgi:hypothetical protein